MSESRKEYNKTYRESHKDAIKEKQKAYYQANKEKLKERQKLRRQVKKDQIYEYNKKYVQEHKDEVAAYQKAYYNDHKEEIDAYHKIYYKSAGAIQHKIGNCKGADKENGRECNINYDFCVELLQQQNYLCACCNKQVKMSWETPLDPEQFSINRKDNKLGHLKDNVEITCWGCNQILQ